MVGTLPGIKPDGKAGDCKNGAVYCPPGRGGWISALGKPPSVAGVFSDERMLKSMEGGGGGGGGGVIGLAAGCD